KLYCDMWFYCCLDVFCSSITQQKTADINSYCLVLVTSIPDHHQMSSYLVLLKHVQMQSTRVTILELDKTSAI
ncbi:hypothetical protein BgiMline_026625, partial [Biomphalaria glabrata]